MRWTDELKIETPEQIEVDLELAGLGSRFVAQFLDWLVKLLVTGAVTTLLLITAALLGSSKLIDDLPTVVQAGLVVLLYLLWLGYGVFFEVKYNGQTPGKRVAGIRVLRAGGAAVDFQAAGIRNLLAIADFLPAFHLLGAVLILLTPNRQRLGDLAAGTVVVRERAAGQNDAGLYDLLTDAVSEITFTATQVAALTPADRTVLRSFLQRAAKMDPASRDKLARTLAAKYQAKIDDPVGAGPRAPRAYLASLLRDLEQSRRVD